MNKLFIMFFTLMLFVSACSNNPSNITEEFLSSVPHPKSTKILDMHQTDDYEVVFYVDETGFRIGYSKAEDEYWTHTANGELKPVDGFDWVMKNDPTIPVALFGGIITDEQITTVLVKQKTLEEKAKIVETVEGFKYWYAIFDVLEEADSGEPDPLKVEALDNNGNILWKDGVYGGVFFSGKTSIIENSPVTATINNKNEFTYLEALPIDKIEKYNQFLEDGNTNHLINFTPEQIVLIYMNLVLKHEADKIYILTFNNGQLPSIDDFKNEYEQYLSNKLKEDYLKYRYYDSIAVVDEKIEDGIAIVKIEINYGNNSYGVTYPLRKENNIWKMDLYHLVEKAKEENS